VANCYTEEKTKQDKNLKKIVGTIRTDCFLHGFFFSSQMEKPTFFFLTRNDFQCFSFKDKSKVGE
jgi:hypothetical protein